MSQSLFKAASLSLCLLFSGPALAADYVLKVSSPTNNDSILKWMQGFERRVEDTTGGKIDIQLFPANQLGQIPATVEGVSMGTIEVTVPASSFFVQYDKRFEVLDVPGLFGDFADAQKTLAKPEVLDHLATYGADQGLHTLAAFPHGPLGLASVKPVQKLDDLKGQRIRVAGPSALATGPLSALGASPISLPLGEALPAMQNGVMDGLIGGLPIFTTGHYYDVAKDLTILPKSYLIVTAVASQTFLDTIGDDLAGKVEAAAREAIADANAAGQDGITAIEGVWQKNGGKIIELSEEDQKAFLDVVGGVLPKAEAENPELAGEIRFFKAQASN